MKKILIALLCLAICLGTVLAHGGRTDGSGGHWNHSTGEYHYHHGYKAHQHIDGVCPYDFKDKTSHSSGSSSSKSSSQKPAVKADTSKKETKEEPLLSRILSFLEMAAFVVFYIFLIFGELLSSFFEWLQEKFRKK